MASGFDVVEGCCVIKRTSKPAETDATVIAKETWLRPKIVAAAHDHHYSAYPNHYSQSHHGHSSYGHGYPYHPHH